MFINFAVGGKRFVVFRLHSQIKELSEGGGVAGVNARRDVESNEQIKILKASRLFT